MTNYTFFSSAYTTFTNITNTYNMLLNNHRQENVGTHQKEIPHTQGQRRSHNKSVGGGTTMFKIKPHIHQRHFEGTNKNLCTPGPRERSSDPHKRLSQTCLKCVRVSCGGMGQHWPAVGTGALAAVLGGAACGISPFGGGPH